MSLTPKQLSEPGFSMKSTRNHRKRSLGGIVSNVNQPPKSFPKNPSPSRKKFATRATVPEVMLSSLDFMQPQETDGFPPGRNVLINGKLTIKGNAMESGKVLLLTQRNQLLCEVNPSTDSEIMFGPLPLVTPVVTKFRIMEGTTGNLECLAEYTLDEKK
jgi:hypothetical protein